MKRFRTFYQTSLNIAMLLTLTLGVMCFIPQKSVYAESVVWQKIEFTESSIEGDEVSLYGFTKNGQTWYKNGTDVVSMSRYLYVFVQGSGGMGGYLPGDKTGGYGGGSGAFAIIKIDMNYFDTIFLQLGHGGGKFAATEDVPFGTGFPTGIIALQSANHDIEAIVLHGGSHGTIYAPGNGGIIDKSDDTPAFQVPYFKNGNSGGSSSPYIAANLGFRTEYFIYRPAGAYPSGQGGAASVYHRGGDGGVWGLNGKDGTKGSGGGGAGHGDRLPGNGGDAYMEIYTSNM